MSEVTYTATIASDIDELMLTLRPEDREELEVGAGMPARDVLEQSAWNSHEVGTLRVDGVLLAIVGLGSADMFDDLDIGVPWLIGSTSIDSYKVTFMHWTRERVLLFLEQYERLYNFVYAKNERSVRWLKAIGFTLDDPIEFGPNKAMFHPFHMQRGA